MDQETIRKVLICIVYALDEFQSNGGQPSRDSLIRAVMQYGAGFRQPFTEADVNIILSFSLNGLLFEKGTQP